MSQSLTFVHQHDCGDDHIAMLWQLMRLVRGMQENPLMWKLTDPFLDAVAQFYHIAERNRLFSMTFLDVSMDITNNVTRLVCEQGSFPVDLVVAA